MSDNEQKGRVNDFVYELVSVGQTTVSWMFAVESLPGPVPTG